jgi:hypothetical protein
MQTVTKITVNLFDRKNKYGFLFPGKLTNLTTGLYIKYI